MHVTYGSEEFLNTGRLTKRKVNMSLHFLASTR